jgi:Tol biopolymer transport system component
LNGRDYGYYDVAQSGTLAYLAAGSARERSLVWVDASGRVTEVTERRRNYEYPRISPRGDRIAVTVHSVEHDVWVHEIGRDTLTRMTTAGANGHPVWTPDGSYILYTFDQASGQRDIYRKKSDGTGESEPVGFAEDREWPSDFTPDGRSLVYYENAPKTQADICVSESGGSPRPLIQTSFNEYWPRLSPDGRFLSYSSDESGRDEIYVQPFPEVDRRWLVSANGGREALWSRDGKAIFYREDDKVMSVAVETRPEFAAKSPKLLFENAAFHRNLTGGEFNYDVAPDGRFLMIRREDALAELQLNVVLNWTEELKRLVASTTTRGTP